MVYAVDYDEFDGLSLYASDIGIAPDQIPTVKRLNIASRDCDRVSGLRWGLGDPEVVYLHGGGQNAHTWDSVAMTVGRPALALDLPGHGHSAWREDGKYTPWANADVVAEVLAEHAPEALIVVGMSLGGLTLIRLAAAYPELARRAFIVDVTPGVSKNVSNMTRLQRGATLLTQGQRAFASFDEMLNAAAATMPGRSRERMWWGVRHNARPVGDGTWEWRYDGRRTKQVNSFDELWEELGLIRVPVLLARGGNSVFVSSADVHEFIRRQPTAQVEVVPGAGHAVQSDQPLLLSRLIEGFITKVSGR
jgi:esterase